MFVLLIKASLVLLVLLAFYKLVLEKESFFSANRVYLLLCLVFAFVLPLVVAPKVIDNQGVVDELLSSRIELTSSKTQMSNNVPIESVPSEKESISVPFAGANEINTLENRYEASLDSKNSTLEPNVIETQQSKGLFFWLKWIYLFGVIVLSINLILQVVTVVWQIYTSKDKISDESFTIVNLKGEVEPCSFFTYIFINPELYDFNSYEQIIHHEKVHASKWHSLDILFAELSVIALWFNPLVWMLRKEVEKNIEYQTDFSVLKENVDDKENYQMNLVKIACHTSPLVVTTNYNQSLIKQRILKMNSKRSNSFSYWKYVFSIPMIFGLVLLLNRPVDIQAQMNYSANESSVPLENDRNRNSKDEEYENVLEKKPSEKRPSEKIEHKKQSEEQGGNVKGDIKKATTSTKPLNEKSSLDVDQSLRDRIIEKEGESVCDRLIEAVRLKDHNDTRWILLKEDLACISDEMGMPFQNIALIKGLLEYGAHLNILNGQHVEIEDITFIIDVSKYEGYGCTDENYGQLVEAIREDDVLKCKALLLSKEFACPLNSNGVKNDFPFIKEMLHHGALLKIENNAVLSVYGVQVLMDIVDFEAQKVYKDLPKRERSVKDALEQNTSESTPCIDLMEEVRKGHVEKCRELLEELDPNCFHKHTQTKTTDGVSVSSSEIHTPLLEAIRYNQYEIAKMIIDDGADIESGDGEVTPLMIAVLLESADMVKLLLEEGANVAKKDTGGWKALDYALDLKNQKIIDLLNTYSR